MKWSCNFEEVKKALRPPYTENWTCVVMEVNCTGRMYDEDVDIIDIELSVREYDEKHDELVYDYCICHRVKYQDDDPFRIPDDWEEDDIVDFGDVEPRYMETEEELKHDMYMQLKKYCDSKGIELLEEE